MNKKSPFIFFALIPLFFITACFKNDPYKEMMRAGGSWKIETVEINNFDSLGNELNSQQLENGGMLMLSHNDDFLFEGAMSIAYDSAVFSQSEMGTLFLSADIWGVSNGAKTFNLSQQDGSTGYTHYLVGFTIQKFRRNRMDLQHIRLNNGGIPVYQETWKLKRATAE
jgi:hypothetical protein